MSRPSTRPSCVPTTVPASRDERPTNSSAKAVAGRDRSPPACRAARCAPLFMTAMRSDMVSASSWSCVTKTEVVPSSRSRRRRSICMLLAQLAVEGGEAARRAAAASGRTASARATATRCCWPPESARTDRSAKSARCTSSRKRFTAAAISALPRPRAFRPKATFSATVRCGKQRVVLEHDADVALVRRQRGDVLAVELRPCRDRRRASPATMRSKVVLPQPEGPEQRHELALADAEIDAVQHRRGAEGFGRAGDVEKCRGRHGSPHIAISRSQRLTQPPRSLATNAQSRLCTLTSAAMPSGGLAALFDGKAKVSGCELVLQLRRSAACRSAPAPSPGWGRPSPGRCRRGRRRCLPWARPS